MKKLGFWEVFSIGVGGMIGGGIFAVLGLSLQLADGAAFLSFIIAGLVALATGYSYAKLSSRYPSEGGTVEFIVQAYGDTIIAGGLNILLLSSYIIMIALYAHAFASYAASLAPQYYSTLYPLFTAFIIISLTTVNMLGAKTSGRLELVLVAFKLLVLASIVAASLSLVDWSKLSPASWPSPASIIAGGMIIFLAYEGFELVANTAIDAENTSILRKALYASILVVIAVYAAIGLVASGALSPREVEEYRDYVLAVLAKPILGVAGFTLVVAAAIASTGSAINATLYGTARVSYIVAKYGEAPRLLEERIWREAYEGLLVVAALSLAVALALNLEAISLAGSGAFLTVFASVNYAAYRLRDKIKANPLATLAATILCLLALGILVYKTAPANPSQPASLAALIASSFIVEAAYRKTRKRRLPQYVDPKLAEREKLVREWRNIAQAVARTVKKIAENAETHIIGSIARGEIEKSGDIDILVEVPDQTTRKTLAKIIVEKIIQELNLPHYHPLHIHILEARRAKRIKEKKKIESRK